jgi:hypothetical protein
MRFKHPFALLTFSLLLVLSLKAVHADVPSNDKVSKNERISPVISQIFTFTAVTVSGRVKTPGGRPIKGATIVLKDSDTNEVVRSTISNSFGYYRLDQIETGRLYVLAITHRRYLFVQPAQLIEINEDKSGIDFVGDTDN